VKKIRLSKGRVHASKIVFSRQFYELKDYSKTLEIEIDTLKKELKDLAGHLKKERKDRKLYEEKSSLSDAA
jgi:hypothetical protein